MTLDELTQQVYAALDERLVVEEPPMLGQGVIVEKMPASAVVVVDAPGSRFLVFVTEVMTR